MWSHPLLNTMPIDFAESFTSLDGELYVSMDNLTNSHYAYYPGYPMGGIMWFFGCKLKF